MLFTIWNREGEKDRFKIDHDFVVTFSLTRAGTKIKDEFRSKKVVL